MKCSVNSQDEEMKRVIVVLLVAFISVSCSDSDSGSKKNAKHLFILSGQSNMVGLIPDESFTPAVEAAFGPENIIVVKDAAGGQPIRRWYRDWRPEQGDRPRGTGDLYENLMAKVDSAIAGATMESITFIWMQGERDAREKHGSVYAASLSGLLGQLSEDLARDDINFVIGRLSDFDMENERLPHWTMVRDAQVQFADHYERGAWVDTDDLNDGVNRDGKEIENDLHYSSNGYIILGQRFAEKAIALIIASQR